MEGTKEYTKQYYIDNKEIFKARNKQYYIDNKERLSIRNKKYYAKNKETLKLKENYKKSVTPEDKKNKSILKINAKKNKKAKILKPINKLINNKEAVKDVIDLLTYNLTANTNDLIKLFNVNKSKLSKLTNSFEFKKRILVAEVYSLTSSGKRKIYYLSSRSKEVFKEFKLVESKDKILSELKEKLSEFLLKVDLIDFDVILQKFSMYFTQNIKTVLKELDFKFKVLRGKNKFKKIVIIRKSIKLDNLLLMYFISKDKINLSKVIY